MYRRRRKERCAEDKKLQERQRKAEYRSKVAGKIDSSILQEIEEEEDIRLEEKLVASRYIKQMMSLKKTKEI